MKAEQYVIFTLGETHFGVNINQVRRIVRHREITRVPRAPHFMVGVLNYQGGVVPAIDLHDRLALQTVHEYDDKSRILIVELEAQLIGMLVDTVVGISRLASDEIKPPPQMVEQVNGVYLTGVIRLAEQVVILLDLSRVLTVAEVEHLDAYHPGDN